MAVPKIKRLIREDFGEQKSWIGKLIDPLNQALTSLKSLLNHGLTFEDNFIAQVKHLTFVYNSTNLPLYFTCTLKGRPKGLWLISIIEEDTAATTAFSEAVFPTWEHQQDGRIKILDLTGLTTDQTYSMTMVII